MTRVVKIEKNGGPEVLQIKNVDLQEIHPDQVLIETKAIGLNYIDTYHRSGSYPLPLPSEIGVEASAKAKVYILAASGIGTPRLLLSSNDGNKPGIAAPLGYMEAGDIVNTLPFPDLSFLPTFEESKSNIKLLEIVEEFLIEPPKRHITRLLFDW